MTRRCIWLLLGCALCAPFALSQSKTDGVIVGRISIEDGRSAAGIEVTAARIGASRPTGQTVLSDEEGAFQFVGLTPGVYEITAPLAGFVVEGVLRGGNLYRVGETAILRFSKGGVITGRLTDETGEPIVGVSVLPQRVRGLEPGSFDERLSSRELSRLGFRGGQTDDRGVYRLFGLPPGVYVVGVGGLAGNEDGSAISRDVPTFHPSAPRDTAVELTLHGAEEISGADIRHRGEIGRLISSVLSGAIDASNPFSNTVVELTSVEPGRFEAITQLMSSRGFLFSGVPDGEYELRAWGTGQGNASGAAAAPKRVSMKGADLSGIELKLQPLASIAGRVEIEPKKCEAPAGAASALPSRKVFVEELGLRPFPENNKRSLSIPEHANPGVVPAANGEFRVKDLDAGRYFLTADLPSETWYLRAIVPPAPLSGLVVKSGEALSGVVVKIAEGAASLEGKLAPRTRVHLVPAEPEAANDTLRYAETVTEANGEFRLTHLAPGKYWLLSRPATAPPPERPTAWDPTERARLRREAEAAKKALTLAPCERAKKTMNAE